MIYDCIVVGAGAAGLAATRALANRGASVLLLEARDRLGGRMHTVYPDRTPVELGAEFIHGRPAETFSLAKSADLRIVEVSGGHLLYKDGRLMDQADLWESMEPIFSGLAKAGKTQSFADHLAGIGRRKVGDSQRAMALAYVEGFNAADARRISARELAMEQKFAETIDESRNFRFVEGYGAFVRAMASGLGGAAPVRLNTVARQVRWRPGRVRVLANAGAAGDAEFAGRTLLITLPLGVLQAGPDELGALVFDPDLPAKREVAARLVMGTVMRMTLRFREPFWEQLKANDRRPDLMDLSFIHSRQAPLPTWWTQRPMRAGHLTAWAGGPAALALLKNTPDQLIALAIDSLSRVLSVRPRQVQDRLQSWHWHNWQADPFSRGAYSYVPAEGLGMRAKLALPVKSTLFFAGEATHSAGMASTVAGAIATGNRAAAEIAKALG